MLPCATPLVLRLPGEPSRLQGREHTEHRSSPGRVPLRAACATTLGAAVGISRQRCRPSTWRGSKVVLASEPKEETSSSSPDAARVALVSQRLTAAEGTLQRWGYVAEVVYTWLGLISMSVSSFAAYSQGGLRAFRNSSMGLGLAAVSLSVMCALLGWFQARSCRTLGRRCGLAAKSLEPGGPLPPASQLTTMIPSLASVEAGLRARQRTAWLGALFAVVGLQAMVGLMVAKVLATSGGFGTSPGLNLDIFTLLAVGNSALAHIIGGGAAALQQGALPVAAAPEDPFQGWGRQ